MYKLPENWLSELKAKNNIVDVVSSYVKLNKTGSNYFANCPFHKEKTPSFCVNEDGQFYYCFSCHVSGDVIGFVKEYENLTFMEAVKKLALRAGMTLPSLTSDDKYAEIKKEKDTLYSLMVECARHYHNNLLTDKRASSAREYLLNRGVGLPLIKRFGLGFSVDSSEIVSFLESKGFSLEQGVKAGVLEFKNGKYSDALSERIIFPVLDILGQVVAFGGRVMGKTKFAKYKNTKETSIFSKSNNLYGINLVKKLKQTESVTSLIIVEGYMDVIALHKAGIQNVVASMGTALTSEQIRLMKRFTSNIFISYDGDSAGQNATLRGLRLLKEENADVKVLSLPEGLDPDDVIKKSGKEGYLKLIDEALPFTEFIIKNIAMKFNTDTPDGKAKFANAALEELSKLSSYSEKEVYLPLVQKISGISFDVLRRQLYDGEFVIKDINYNDNLSRDNEKAFEKAIKFILYCALTNKKFYDKSSDISSFINNDAYLEIYTLIEQFSSEGNINPSKIAEATAFKDVLEDILSNGGQGVSEENEKNYYFDCLKLVKENDDKKTIQNLFKMYNGEIDAERKKQILKEIQKLTNPSSGRRND